MNVSLVLWDEKEQKSRILERETFTVKELDLKNLSIIAMDLADKMIEGMLLETLGKRRSETEFVGVVED